mgnify:CR=1 FL=1
MIRSVWFSKHLNSHLKSTELPPACYSESTASSRAAEQPIPTDATEYTSLDQKTLQKNHGYAVKSQPETDMACEFLSTNCTYIEFEFFCEQVLAFGATSK